METAGVTATLWGSGLASRSAAALVNRVTAQPAPTTSTAAATYASERMTRPARVARAAGALAGGTASVGMSGSAGKVPVLIRGALFPRARSRRMRRLVV